MGTQNLNNYNFNRIDAKLNYSSYYDFFLVSDEKDFNTEALISKSGKEWEFYFYEQSAYNGAIYNDEIPSKLLYSKKLKSISLTTIVREKGIKEINFMSIDVEGLDLNVLQSFFIKSSYHFLK